MAAQSCITSLCRRGPLMRHDRLISGLLYRRHNCIPNGRRAKSTDEASKAGSDATTSLGARVSQRDGGSHNIRRPYLMQVCGSLAIFLVGDLLAQWIGGKKYDPAQTGRMLVIGGTASIPVFKWYRFVSTKIHVKSGLPKFLTASVLTTAVQTAVTCCVLTPVMSTYFFGMHSLLSGHDMASTWQHLQRTLPRSWKSAFLYWPVANATNFALVPTPYKGIFQAGAGLIWQTYMAILNKLAADQEAIEKETGGEKKEPVSVGAMKISGSV